MGKKWLDFSDLDLIYHLDHYQCPIFTKKSLSALYFLNQMMDSGQTLCIVPLG